MKIRISIILVILCFPLLIQAETEPEPLPESGFENDKVSVRFMSWERALTGLYTTPNGREYQPIHAPAYALGRHSTVPKGRDLELYKKSTDANGQLIYEMVLSAPMPKSATECAAYLMPRRDDSGKPRYHMIVLDQGSTDFTAGDVRVLNFSQYPSMVRLGENSFRLDPLEVKQVNAMPDKKYRVILRTALMLNGEWVRGGQEVLSIRPGYRGEVMVLYTGAAGRFYDDMPLEQDNAQPLTVSVSEYVPPPVLPE